MRTIHRLLRQTLVLAILLASTSGAVPAFAEVVLHLQSQPGDPVGQGGTLTLREGSGDVFTVDGPSPTFLNLWVTSAGGWSWNLNVQAPVAFVVGSYEGAERFPFQAPGAPGLYVFRSNGPACHDLTGRFEVFEIVMSGGQIQSLALDFEQHCDGTLPALYGQLRINSAVPVVLARTLPDPWEFAGVTDASPGQQIVSAPAMITGINVAVPVAITGGEYSVNGGPFTALPGTIANGQTLRARVTAAPLPNRLATADLRVGLFRAPFHVGTAAGPEPQPHGEPLTVIVAQPGQSGGGTFVYSPATLATQRFVKNYYVPQFDLLEVRPMSGGPAIAEDGRFGPGIPNARLSPGTYTGAVPWLDSGIGRPVLEWTGWNPHCANQASGTFTVLEVEYDAEQVPTKLALDFEQVCGDLSLASAVFGHIRFNSLQPIDYTVRIPHPMDFTPVTGVTPSEIVTSSEVVIQGVTVPVPISIAGGEYSIDGGGFVSTPGTISAGQRLRLRLVASPAPNDVVIAQVTVGGRTASFRVGTAPGTEPQPSGTPLIVIHAQADPVGSPGTSLVFSHATLAAFTTTRFGQGIQIQATRPSGGSSESVLVRFAGIGGAAPSPGVYADLREQADGTHGALAADIPSRSCIAGPEYSRVVIHEVEYAAGGALTRLAMDFTIGCPETEGPSAFGYIRYYSTVPIDYAVRLPNPFTFATVSNATPGTLVISSEALIDGISAPAAITVSGGEYSLDSGPFTSMGGTVSAGQRVRVRLTAPANANALASARLLVDRRPADFRVGTVVGTAPQPQGEPLLVLVSEAGDPVGQGTTRIYSGAAFDEVGIGASGAIEQAFFGTTVGGPPGSTGTLAGPGPAAIVAGDYPQVAKSATANLAGLHVAVDGRGCAATSGRIQVHEAQYESPGRLAAAAFDFVQYCDGTSAGLRGYFRYNSTVPIDYAPDSTPEAFSFAPVTGAPRNQWVVSAPVVITGINATAAVGVTLGEVSVDGGAFTALPTTLHAGQSLQVRVMSSPNHDEERQTFVMVGGRLGTFAVRTLARPVLTVTVANGQGGTVTSIPAGIACPGACVATFDEGVPLELVATPQGGTSFAGWSGACTGLGPCQLTLSGPATVATSFTYPLTVTRLGSGHGSVLEMSAPYRINCGATCSGNYAAGATVSLQAIFSGNMRFVGWGGACAGNAGTGCTVSMDSAKSVTATFEPYIATPENARVDWNGDGRPDLLFHHSSSGALVVCYMENLAVQSCQLIGTIDASWKIVGVADFGEEGRPEIVLRDAASGTVALRYYIANIPAATVLKFPLDFSWTVEAVADFTADGNPDFLVRDSTSGVIVALASDNGIPQGAQALFPLDAGWKIQAVGDFDRDGHPDLVLRHSSGVGLIWGTGYAGGATTMAGAPMGQFQLDPAWEVAQVADWNGDGKVDLLMRNASTGEIVILYCDGASIVEAEFLLQLDPVWEIVPRR